MKVVYIFFGSNKPLRIKLILNVIFLYPNLFNLTITGLQRLKPSYVTNLFKPFILSGDHTPFKILSRVASFDLHHTNSSYFLKINEYKRSLQLKYPFSLSFTYPNVFGSGELLKLNVDNKKNCFFSIDKPYKSFLVKLRGGNIWGLEILDNKRGLQLSYQKPIIKESIKASKPIISFPFINISANTNFTRFIENEKIYDKVGLFFCSIFNSNIKVQSGITPHKKPYTTIVLSKLLEYRTKFMFANLLLSENVFISKKKKTFTGCKSEIGLFFNKNVEDRIKKELQFYVLYATGIDSKQLNLYDTWKSLMYAQLIMPQVRNYDACIGLGVRIPINEQKLNIMYKWGLIWKKTSGLSITFEI